MCAQLINKYMSAPANRQRMPLEELDTEDKEVIEVEGVILSQSGFVEDVDLPHDNARGRR